ncbi:MAG: acyl-CoA dehydrogenase family protein [Polyangiaceae bacterium]
MREQSFTKSLFFGVIDESLVFPWPEPEFDDVSAVIGVLDTVRRFFTLRVDSAEIDRQERIPDEVLKGLKDIGCFGLSIPKAHGGLGLTNSGYARVIQEIAGLDASIAATLAAHQSLGAKAILLFGTEDQKQRYLPGLATGELTAAFALAETGAGSDAGEIQTRAELQADGSYLLNGSKTWIINGGFARLFVVFARTSLVEDGVKPRITAFLVERGPGVRSGQNQSKLGIRGASTTELHFHDVRVPAGNVLGEAGRGFKVAMQVLDSARLGLASGCVGICKRILKMCVERCRERRAFGRPIGEFGLIKDKIATMMAETWALECMTYLTAGQVDRGVDDFSVESAICKVFGSEACLRVVSEALQIAAGLGYMAERPYERLLRDARVNIVFQGTNETLRAFIALSGMQGPGQEIVDVARAMREPIKGFGLLTDFAIRKARGALGRERMTRHHAVLNREAVIVEEYVQQLSRAVETVLRKHGRDIAEMQYTQKRAADLAIDLYGIVACIVRTSHVVEKRGEQGARREIDLTSVAVASAERRLAQVVAAVDKNDDELRKAVASRTYVDGGYPFDVV